MYQALFDHLPAQYTLLTPNQRLGAYLRRLYAEGQSQTLFSTPDILPIEAWLHRLYETALSRGYSDRLVLTQEQCLALWEKIIIANPGPSPLLVQTHKTAALAHKAWELMHRWSIPLSALEHSHHAETEQFLQWLNPFQNALAEQQYITPVELPTHLLNCLPQDYLKTLPPLYRIGFDEKPPQLEVFLAHLQTQGVLIVEENAHPSANHAKQIGFKNKSDELYHALRYAQMQWQENKTARIGIVIPEISQHRQQIIQLCQQLFYPEAVFLNPENMELINISGGIPLSHTLFIQSIWTVLNLKADHMALPDLHLLWHSPYLSFEKYESVRPSLERRLAEKHSKYISQATLLGFLERSLLSKNQEDSSLPRFYQALQSPPSQDPSRKSHRLWAEIISEYLNDLGFPGQRSLHSSDYQRLHAWQEVLETFISLDRIESQISFKQALTSLQHLCDAKLFQGKTKDAPIQILGLLEACGQQYTHLWMLGLNEGIFPARAKPHPFLPLALQQHLRMPHCDAAREFNFSEKIFARLNASTKTLICSYSEEEADFQLRASPLLRTLSPLDKSEFSLKIPPIQIEKPKIELEYRDDRYGLPLPEDAHDLGGSYLFKLQALCPFRAYARLRLNIEGAHDTSLGLSPAIRGNLVHLALHYCYPAMTTQTALLALSPEEAQVKIRQACQQALLHLHERQPPDEHPQHYYLEMARLEKLLWAFLDSEKQRPDFTVLASEQRLDVFFAGLALGLQIDRIDRLDDGIELIIDYKTGNVQSEDWFSERPNEPQLPLYCQVYSGPVKALAFAKVNVQAIQIKGVGHLTQEWPAIKPLALQPSDLIDPFEQQKKIWQTHLSALAEEFKQGLASVSPKEGPKTCQYCDFGRLCRIKSSGIFLEDESDD